MYTLRTSPSSKTGIAFGILVTLAGLGRFIGTLIQPSLIQETTQVYGPWIMIGCMMLFGLSLLFIKSDLEPDPAIIFNKD